MTLALKLQNFLTKNGLTVEVAGVKDVAGVKFEVRDREGKLICTGATEHTAVRKAMWLRTCPCQLAGTGKKDAGE